MKRLSVVLCGIGSAALADPIAVPSGQSIEFKQVIWAEAAETPNAIFRFVAPEITRDGTGIEYDTAAEDILFLCETFALPRVLAANVGGEVGLVISLSKQDLAFGEANPDILQFFENFVVRDATCDWGDV
ncbi:DUF6497 family protein [Falsihalocynthiibacter arcticus]|uniref:Acetolactate synthase n=1 Tax=Falsihalocynthiibacter arcticus TaxID=1579316 RepID=A0A126UWH6_9RHOB|nr:DUF6497 family protein [Falsihalocynthiibacter arcticus]AML49996.1 hypothetical protein RC74_00715 [Falsihalocynthiibacter arcticus]